MIYSGYDAINIISLIELYPEDTGVDLFITSFQVKGFEAGFHYETA
jgi:hypothetical protein